MSTITLIDDEIKVGERFSLTCQRTLRIPDDGKEYPLPPGLDRFPIHRVMDFQERCPSQWKSPNAFFIPMYQREALWLCFNGADWKPNAVKIAVGGINALSGEPSDAMLRTSPQDYLVIPDQPWLDGVNIGEGMVRQFVAAPLGSGRTIESQLTGADETGGMEITVFEPVAGRFPDQAPPKPPMEIHAAMGLSDGMGIGAGGQVQQKIYPDEHGIKSWDVHSATSFFIYILNSEVYRDCTGKEAPPSTVSAKTYTEFHLPWFSLYDEAKGDVEASAHLQKVRSTSELDAVEGVVDDQNESVEVKESDVQKLEWPPKPTQDGD